MAKSKRLGPLQAKADFKTLAARLTERLVAVLDHSAAHEYWGSMNDSVGGVLWNLAVLDALVDALATHAANMILSPSGQGPFDARLFGSESIRGDFFQAIAAMIREEMERIAEGAEWVRQRTAGDQT